METRNIVLTPSLAEFFQVMVDMLKLVAARLARAQAHRAARGSTVRRATTPHLQATRTQPYTITPFLTRSLDVSAQRLSRSLTLSRRLAHCDGHSTEPRAVRHSSSASFTRSLLSFLSLTHSLSLVHPLISSVSCLPFVTQRTTPPPGTASRHRLRSHSLKL